MAILVTFCRNIRFIAYSSDIRNVSVIIILTVYFPFYFPLEYKNMEVMRKEFKIITPIKQKEITNGHPVWYVKVLRPEIV